MNAPADNVMAVETAGALAPAPIAARRRTEAAHPAASWSGDIAGGIGGAIVSVIFALSFGLLAFAPLGPDHVSVGVLAGLAAAIYGQLVAGLLGGSAHPGSSPRATESLILAGLVAIVAADPVFAPSATAGPERVVAVASLCVMVSGVIQLVFAWLRVGQIARYVPYPFIAGFMTGVSILFLFTQLPALAGLPPGALDGGTEAILRAIQPATLFVGLASAATIVFVAEKVKRVPSVLAGVAAGVAVYYALRHFMPEAKLGPVVGAIPSTLPTPMVAMHLFDVPLDALIAYLPVIAATAAVLAAIGTLDTLIANVVVDHATDGRHDSRREVLAHGLANVASGACGGVPVAYSAARALASWNAGGRSKRSTVVAVLIIVVLLLAGSDLIAGVPFAVLSGVMVTLAIALLDRWARSMIARVPEDAQRRDTSRLLSVATVLIVATTTIAFGFVPAIITGVVLSVLLLLVGMNRSLVRSVVDGTVRPSRRIWSHADTSQLTAARQRIRVVELEGPVFFGSAERLAEEVEPLAGSIDVVVLDFRHVTAIDATGGLLLERLTRRMAKLGTSVLLASVTPEGRLGRELVANNAFVDPSERRWFRDADQAVEWAERNALEGAGRVRGDAIAIFEFDIFDGLKAEEIASVAERMVRLDIPQGEVLFREGDPGTSLYLLAQGAIEISIAIAPGQRSRIVTMAAGSIFGDAALLDGQPRSAAAVAAEPAVLYELSRAALFDDLAVVHPPIAITLIANLARELSQRMRETNEILRRLDDSRG